MQRETQLHLWYGLAAVIGVLLLQYFWALSQQVEPIPYSAFETYLHDGKIAEITISQHYVYGKFKEPLADGKKEFVTDRVEPAFADELAKYGVTFAGTEESTFLRDVLSWVLPVLFFFALWIFVFRRIAASSGLGGGLMAVGKSKAKVYVETDTKVTFDDVAGVDEAKEELQRDRRLPQEPEGIRSARRAHSEGRAAGGAAGHRQDPARPRRRGRGRRAVLLHQRLGIRRDVRRRRRGARARPLRAGAPEGAGHHLHRRARRARPRARRLSGLRRPRREGADAEPAPVRARRLRHQRAAWCCSPPPTGRRFSTPRCCARAASTARCWSTGRTARAAFRSSRSICKGITAGARCLGGRDRRADAGLHRRRPRQSRQRGGAGRDAAQGGRGDDGGLHRGGGADRRRPREKEPAPQSPRARGRGLSRDGPRAGGDVAAGQRYGAQGVDHSARHRRARLHHPAARPRTAIS